jgi:hypothetical protein
MTEICTRGSARRMEQAIHELPYMAVGAIRVGRDILYSILYL